MPRGCASSRRLRAPICGPGISTSEVSTLRRGGQQPVALPEAGEGLQLGRPGRQGLGGQPIEPDAQLRGNLPGDQPFAGRMRAGRRTGELPGGHGRISPASSSASAACEGGGRSSPARRQQRLEALVQRVQPLEVVDDALVGAQRSGQSAAGRQAG